jgi:thiol-disulfide isomerase/thioredoxin
MVNKYKTKRKLKYRQTRKNQKSILVGKIYANWCGYCKTLKPIWDTLKTEAALKKINFVEFEESEKEKLEEFKRKSIYHAKLNYAGYPTIFKFYNNKFSYYDGPQNKELIKKWILGKN